MTWSVARLPGFVAADSAAMLAELVSMQVEAMRHGVTDEAAYARAYALAFSGVSLADFVYQPPAVVAAGVTQLIRQVGLFGLLDDGAALAFLFGEASWETDLPPVRIARPGPVYTATRQRQQQNRVAMAALVHRAACLAFCERLPSVAFADLPRTFQVRNAVTAMFGTVIDEASALNDGTVRTLRQIQTQAWVLIDRRSPINDGEITLPGYPPSLVAAHLAYREARQVQRIRDANPTAHPLFMPGTLVVPPWP